MRLSSKQVKSIINAVAPFILPNEKIELRLFGSRLDDDLHGGDLDLLIVCRSEHVRSHIEEQKASILAKIYMALDEENVDILIVDKNKVNDDAFAKMAYDTSKILHIWNENI